jgi:hypothetical protein
MPGSDWQSGVHFYIEGDIFSPIYNGNGQKTIEVGPHFVPTKMDQKLPSSVDRFCLAIPYRPASDQKQLYRDVKIKQDTRDTIVFQ